MKEQELLKLLKELIEYLEYANNILKNVTRGMAFGDEELITCVALDRVIKNAKDQIKQ